MKNRIYRLSELVKRLNYVVFIEGKVRMVDEIVHVRAAACHKIIEGNHLMALCQQRFAQVRT
jgi:hypothetical protein